MKEIQEELYWLELILRVCFRNFLQQQTGQNVEDDEVLQFESVNDFEQKTEKTATIYQQYTHLKNISFLERLALTLSLSTYFKPELLDIFLVKNALTGDFYTEFGGIKGKKHRGLIPTGETLAFIYAGEDLEKRKEVLNPARPDMYQRRNFGELA